MRRRPLGPTGIARGLAAVTAALAAVTFAAPAGAAPWTPGPGSPGLGPLGTAAVHGDIYSTDTVPGLGPGADDQVRSSIPGGVCSSVFVGSDGMPVALCTAYVGTGPLMFAPPTVVLLDPATAEPLARLQLAKGALLGGVYGYLDDHDRVVVADGDGVVHAVGHTRDAAGAWRLTDDVLARLGPLIGADDQVTGLAPGTDGRLWFDTVNAKVGTVVPGDPESARILDLPADAGLPAVEHVSNGITVRPGGASVMTTHALYEVAEGDDGQPRTLWRRAYDRGAARHPGMLAFGSGSTPTYFGPHQDDYVAYLDAADESTLFVLDRASGDVRCAMPAFATTEHPATAAPDGRLIDGPAQSENSPIALASPDGNRWSLIIPNTYGFEYVPLAVDGPSVPAQAPYRGGMTSIVTDGAQCTRQWTSTARTATLPKATTGDRMIHTLAYGDAPVLPGGSAAAPAGPVADAFAGGILQKTGPVYYSAIDADTGDEAVRTYIGEAPIDEPMELTGTIAPSGDGGPGVFWQATMGRMLRIGPAAR